MRERYGFYMVQSFDLLKVPAATQIAFFPCMAVLEILDYKKLPYFLPLIERLRHVQHIEGILVVTDSDPKNDPIHHFCKEDSLHCLRGKDKDPLSWFYAAGVAFDLEVYIRLTVNSLKLSHELIDLALFCFRHNYNKLDYLSNTIKPTLPQGYSLELFRFNALQEAFFHAEGSDRKDVTSYITKHPRKFRLGNFLVSVPSGPNQIKPMP